MVDVGSNATGATQGGEGEGGIPPPRDEAELVRRIVELKQQGLGFTKIAEILGISRSQAHRLYKKWENCELLLPGVPMPEKCIEKLARGEKADDNAISVDGEDSTDSEHNHSEPVESSTTVEAGEGGGGVEVDESFTAEVEVAATLIQRKVKVTPIALIIFDYWRSVVRNGEGSFDEFVEECIRFYAERALGIRVALVPAGGGVEGAH